MAARYPDEDYGRGAPRRDRDPRDIRGVDPRAVRRADDRHDITMEDPMDTRMDARMDTRMDMRYDARVDPRGNIPSRMDATRNDRVPDRRQEEPLYQQDPRAQQYYPTQPAPRQPFSPRDEPNELPLSNRRPLIDPSMGITQGPGSQYNEYFLPGDGIDREVIQYELCRYLGQDATCRPGSHPDV